MIMHRLQLIHAKFDLKPSDGDIKRWHYYVIEILFDDASNVVAIVFIVYFLVFVGVHFIGEGKA